MPKTIATAVFAIVMAFPATGASAHDASSQSQRHMRRLVVTHAPPSGVVLGVPVYFAHPCYQYNDRDWATEWVC